MAEHMAGQMSAANKARPAVLCVLLILFMADQARDLRAQPTSPPATATTVTIPYLANASEPAALDFLAAACDRAPDGARLDCRFRQVFVTPTSADPTSCAITTNGYEQTFRRQTDTRWVDTSPRQGDCPVTETTTLEDGGGTRWTLTIRTAATTRDLPQCRGRADNELRYTSQNVRRALPCTSIQPGAIER